MSSEPNERTARGVSTESIPGRPLSWVVVALGVVLIALGRFFTTGEISGLLGLWGASVILTTFVVYGAAALWSALG